MMKVAYVKGRFTYYTDGLVSQENPDHLRAAIERIGIEKPSDVTLVMEEVGRMEAEEKIELVWVQNLRAILKGEVEFSHKMNSAILWAFNEQYAQSATLLSAAEAFISEAESMGYGKTSEKALPGSFDALVKAVREVKG